MNDEEFEYWIIGMGMMGWTFFFTVMFALPKGWLSGAFLIFGVICAYMFAVMFVIATSIMIKAEEDK